MTGPDDRDDRDERGDRDATPAALHSRAGDAALEEVWQIEILALALALVDTGVFTANEWTDALAAAIGAAQAAGDPDRGDTYYDHCSAALERLCTAKGLLTSDGVDQRTEAWRHAFLTTPHGQPVELGQPAAPASNTTVPGRAASGPRARASLGRWR